MLKIRKVDLSDVAKLPNPGLLSYLEHLQRGQTDVYRTPLFHKANPGTVLGEWLKFVERSNINDVFPDLILVEQNQAKKVGVYSVIPPAQKRMAHLKEYWAKVEPQTPILPEAIAKVKELYQVGSLSLWSMEQVKEKMRLNTSAGLPLFTRRRKAWEVYERNRYTQKQPYIALWGTRVSPGGPRIEDEKVRDVFMMPMLLNMYESKYYYPLLEYEQANKLPYSITTLRDTEQAVTNLFDTKGQNDPVIVTDFDGFDQTFRKPLQDAAKETILYAFSRSAHAEILDTFDAKYNIPLLINEDTVLEGERGMGSGATGTNPDENRAHKSLQFEAAITAGQELNPWSRVLGDDGLLSYKGITIEHVIDTYTKHGLRMNESKQSVSTHAARYLQRYYDVSYRDSEGIMLGVYSTCRALGRLLYQERFHDPELWGPEQVILRSLSIIENTKNHPLFKQFVDFAKKGDKYGLGTKLPGFFSQIEGKWEEYKANFGLESYTQQNETAGILSWAVVRYLMNND